MGGLRIVISMASFKEARVVVESGHPEGCGRVLDFLAKFDKFGLGYHPDQRGRGKLSPRGEGSFGSSGCGSPSLIKFLSSSIINEDQAHAVDDEVDRDNNIDN